MHFTVGRGAGKLVRCARGHVYDVLVDLRKGSPTYGQWEGYDITDENFRILYAPPGFAHGFCVVSRSPTWCTSSTPTTTGDRARDLLQRPSAGRYVAGP